MKLRPRYTLLDWVFAIMAGAGAGAVLGVSSVLVWRLVGQ